LVKQTSTRTSQQAGVEEEVEEEKEKVLEAEEYKNHTQVEQ
jgi:hypothetical protein